MQLVVSRTAAAIAQDADAVVDDAPLKGSRGDDDGRVWAKHEAGPLGVCRRKKGQHRREERGVQENGLKGVTNELLAGLISGRQKEERLLQSEAQRGHGDNLGAPPAAGHRRRPRALQQLRRPIHKRAKAPSRVGQVQQLRTS